MRACVFTIVLLALVAGVAQAQFIEGGLLNVQLAKYDPFPAEAGEAVTVWFKAENVGTEPVKNTRFVLESLFPFTVVDGEERIYGNIDAEDDILVEYTLHVDPNAPEGKNEIKLRWSFGDNILTEREFNITVNRTRVADIKVLFVDVTPEPFVGQKVQLTVDIVNTQSGTAYFTVVKAESEAVEIRTNELFVGTLEPDDFESVDFDLIIKDVEPGIYPVNMTLVYKDEDDREILQHDVVMLTILPASAAPNNAASPSLVDILLAIIIIAIVVKWVAYPLVRRRGRK